MELWLIPEGFPKDAATQQTGFFFFVIAFGFVLFFSNLIFCLRFYFLVSHFTVHAATETDHHHSSHAGFFFNITETMWPNF